MDSHHFSLYEWRPITTISLIPHHHNYTIGDGFTSLYAWSHPYAQHLSVLIISYFIRLYVQCPTRGTWLAVYEEEDLFSRNYVAKWGQCSTIYITGKVLDFVKSQNCGIKIHPSSRTLLKVSATIGFAIDNNDVFVCSNQFFFGGRWLVLCGIIEPR